MNGSQHAALLGTCDRCHAPALERVEFKNGELLFCGHHYKEYERATEGAVIL